MSFGGGLGRGKTEGTDNTHQLSLTAKTLLLLILYRIHKEGSVLLLAPWQLSFLELGSNRNASCGIYNHC